MSDEPQTAINFVGDHTFCPSCKMHVGKQVRSFGAIDAFECPSCHEHWLACEKKGTDETENNWIRATAWLHDHNREDS